MALNSLSNVLRDQGDRAGARERFERALAIREAVLEPNHPRVVTVLNNLGVVLHEHADVLRNQGELEQAQHTLQQALRCYRRTGNTKQERKILRSLRAPEEERRSRQRR